jgi:2-desacetyl-2-hydroxyethyl bacteriochlorophyllide A dehydrogenase
MKTLNDSTSTAAGTSVRYSEPKHLVADSSTPSHGPGPGEVAVSPAYIGICGTDLHIYLGHMDGRVAPGTVLGHESSAVVTAVGADVTGWEVGDHVCVFPVVSCETCRTCLAGRGHVCPQLQILGIDADGAMQGSWVVPAANLVRLPADLSLRTAGLVEPLAVAVHDVRRSQLTAGAKALVVGAGPVGLLMALVARAIGADVTVVELSEYRRGIAEEFGLRAVAPDAFADSVDPDEDPDVAFEVTGVGPGLETAYRALTPGGRLVVVGIHPEPRPIDLQSLFQREVEIIGARLYTREDFEEAVELVASGRIDPTALISEVVNMEAAGDAFERLLSGGTAMKILVAGPAS